MRQVKDLTQNDNLLNIKARMTDTYNRPAVQQGTSSLEQIATAFSDINPALNKFIQNSEKEKKDFDVNRGAALYNMLGDDMPWEEAKEKLIKGDISGFKDINNNVRAGYIGERHKAAGLRFTTEMQEWENKGVGIDKDGKEVALSSIEDPNELMNIYSRKQSEVLQSYIGKKYDPKFYGEYIQPAIDANAKQFVSQQSNARAAVLLDRRERAFGETLNAFMDKMIVNNELVFDDTQFTPKGIAGGLMKLSQDIMSGGMPENEVNKQMTTMLRSMMYDYDIDNIDGLKEVAKNLPLWNDPTYRGIIESSAKSAISAKYSSDARKEAAKEQQQQTEIGKAFGSMLEQYDYDPANITASEWIKLMKIAPDNLASVGWISSAQNSFQNIHTNSVKQERAISDNEFYRLYGDFSTGRKGLGSLFSYAAKTTPEQYRELVSGYNGYRSLVGSAGGGRGTKSKATSVYDKTKAAALKFLTAGDGNKATDYIDSVLNDDIASEISYRAVQRHDAWKSKNKDAAPIEQKRALESFIREETLAFGKNKDVYRDNPERLKESPVAVRRSHAVSQAKSLITGLPQKDPVISGALKKIEQSASRGERASFSKQEINDINKSLKKTRYKGNAESVISQLAELQADMM